MSEVNLWLNKQSGQLCLASPHWTPIQIKFDEKFYQELDPIVADMAKGRRIVHGALVQVGWLVQNQNDVWFGMPMGVSEQFEDLGPA